MAAASDIRFPGESDEYRRERNRLLEAEIELRRAVERVAAQRRTLPLGGALADDYLFEEAREGGGEVRFSELFAADKRALVIYSYMFPRYSGDTRPGPTSGSTAGLPLAQTPCASCTSILDSLDGAAPHLAQHINLAVVAKSGRERIRAFAQASRLATAAPALLAQQHLQPRLPRRDLRRRAAADPERVRPRG